MSREPRDAPQFYLTAPSPCPYLPRREERKVFTHLIGKRAVTLNDTLTQSGFRRSQTIAYRPACESCRACVSVRVKVDEFTTSKNLRRVLERNEDVTATVVRAEPTSEQYALFRTYLDARHADGGMADMTVLDYSMMIEDSHVETRLVEYRAGKTSTSPGTLIAVCLTDLLADGLSMVYSFYDPRVLDRSLGTFMILDHIERARRLSLPHLYLGYWVEGSKKMAYKARFLPQERLGMNGWETGGDLSLCPLAGFAGVQTPYRRPRPHSEDRLLPCSKPPLRIGTRGSPLALAQAHQTRDQLREAHGLRESDVEIHIIKVSGDAIVDRPLSEAGGKGLFTKELDTALLIGGIDLAVHSAKDLPTFLPEAIMIAGYLPREDVRDVWISSVAPSPRELPHGARVGTASLRRGAMLRRMRPDVEIGLLRGNVQTRLRKVKEGEFAGTLLALAGLKRLSLDHEATYIIPIEDFLPAAGQGAIGITARVDDGATAELLAPILCHATGVALAAERGFLTALDGSCRTPIGAHAVLDGHQVTLRGTVLRPDGSQAYDEEVFGEAEHAAIIGKMAGETIKARLPAGFFAE